MTEQIEQVPAAGHILPDADWAKVVARAKEVRAELLEDAEGGASGPGGIVLDMTALGIRSKKYFPVSGVPTQLLVLHSAECPLQAGYAKSLSEWACGTIYPAGPIASWQRFVDPVHRVRLIPDELGAWHASEANPLSIGWEQAGYARYTRDQWLTPEGRTQLEMLALDMAEVAVRDGIPARWLADWEVRAVLDQGRRDIKGFCLHRQIDPETRTDPGGGYPYDLLMERIKFYMNGGQPVTTTGGFLMALNDQQQADVHWILCTKDGQEHLAGIIARGVLNYEVPWFGGDGVQPPEGQRRTVNLTAVAGWIDTMFGGTNRNVNEVKDAVKSLAVPAPATVELSQEDVDSLAAKLKETLAPGLAAELARRLAE